MVVPTRMQLSLAGAVYLVAMVLSANARPVYFDRTFHSDVFGEPRSYRIFLPPEYNSTESEKRYPVIYYFHGHSDRYTLEHYDDGKDTVPKIARFVEKKDVIVVSVDGFVSEDYEGFYGGSPWDVRREGGSYDFGAVFLEMVSHIDTKYRTRPSRQFRATSGLSMGGFMSFYLSARYPDMVGSASAFNPGPEFYTGDKGLRMLWRPKDHVNCHSCAMIRLIRASGDYISQYHEETRAAYACASEVEFEYRQDEFHRHWATSIGETFAFHMKAFANSRLNEYPDKWNSSNAYRNFNTWGYEVQVGGDEKAFVYLTDVSKNGLRVTTRSWAPDGPPVDDKLISIATSPRYRPRAFYKIADYGLSTNKTTWRDAESDSIGRLKFQLDGRGHQLSVVGPGVEKPSIVLLPVTTKDYLRLWPDELQSLPIKVFNPSDKAVQNLRISVTSKYPTVEWIDNSVSVPLLLPGEVAEIGEEIKVRFCAGGDYFSRNRLNVTLSADGQRTQILPLDVMVVPKMVSVPTEIEILDGRAFTFSVFRQKGNQGGGSAIERTVTEGKGNGDGILQPGEEATIWVKTKQGLDPIDMNNWHRTKVFSDSEWLVETDDIQELKQREWTGAQERTSVVRLAHDVPPATNIRVLLSNETWSFRYLPDVRFGREYLYQAFQEHRPQLHSYVLEIGRSNSQVP